MYDDVFVMKVYAEGTANNESFAQWLVGQLRRTPITPERLCQHDQTVAP